MIPAIYLAAMIVSSAPMTTEASWYGYECTEHPMANGQPFDPQAYTAASWDYPLGTVLRVTDRENGLPVYVTVTDRGPAKRLVAEGRRLDLSMAAFMVLRDVRSGTARVSVEAIER